jgi:GNAT superfamily N-acetyltransferase
MTDDLQLERVSPGPEREAYLPLLYLADEPEPVRGYLQEPEGALYVLRHVDGAAGVTFVLPRAGEEGTIELRAVAVDPTRHNQGLGRVMLTRVLADCRSRACGG